MSDFKCPMCIDCPKNCPLDSDSDTREHSADYYKGRADALANKVNLIEDSNFNPQMLKSCTDTSYQCGYQQGREDAFKEIAYSDSVIREPFETLAYVKGKLEGAREFAEWLCGKYSRIRQDGIGFEKFQNIHWKSIDEVLAEWQKGVE